MYGNSPKITLKVPYRGPSFSPLINNFNIPQNNQTIR